VPIAVRPYYQVVSFRILRRVFKKIRVRLPTRTIEVPCRDPICLSSLFWEPSWKTQLIARVLAERPGAFIDVGANVGQTLFDYLATGAKSGYFGFEPNVRCAAYLSRLVSHNALGGVALVPIALGDSAELLQLHSLGSSETDSAAFIHPFVRPNWETRSEFIPSLRFDEVLRPLGIEQISLCKIDVEGFELEVLRGMKSVLGDLRPPVLCEVLDADAQADLAVHAERLDRLGSLLDQADYRIFHVNKTSAGLFAGLQEITDFPKRRWDKALESQSDYLFVHRLDPVAGGLVAG